MKPGQHDFNTSDGTRIHYLTLGDTGSWVVLIHGYTGNAHGNWFTNGIAQRLAAKHRVVALDCRNHGRSDKPERGGPGNHQDVIELMDHLGIDKAHIHGYSMGGMITSRILAEAPDRFITASFGGSGIREEDEAWQKQVPKDKQGRDPEEDTCSRNLRVSSAMDNGMSREEAEKRVDAAILEAKKNPPPARRLTIRPLDIDLSRIEVPMLAINGEFDSPWAKTFRLWREARDFTNVILPGKSHLTAIVAGYMPPEYPDSLERFIESNDAAA
ncbi:MAG: alpha/beta hydrolase [Pseudomonadales bacterium]|nr:alpha/beta hydrolase [Pseudomonadales bacterium]